MACTLALDFGTTNSLFAQLTGGPASILALPGLCQQSEGQPPLVPSVLYVDDGRAGRTAVGQAALEAARASAGESDGRLFRNFKRGIVSVPAPEPRLIDGVLWHETDAGRHFLRHLLDALPVPVQDIERLALSAPVASFEGYMAWLAGAVGPHLADPDCISLVDEATAAALGYAVTEPGAVVLVVDFGGGTLDLSLVALPDEDAAGGILGRLRGGSASSARVIAKAGRVLGGIDIDHWLLADVQRRIGETRIKPGGMTDLLVRCEAAKIALSSAEEVTLDLDAAGQDQPLTITRDDLETLLEQHGFYTALRHVVEKVLHGARKQGVFREDVHCVLMVGGSSLVPSVQATLADLFPGTLFRCDKPFTAVVEGALHAAAGGGLDDRLPHSYALRYRAPGSESALYDELIPAGTPCPARESFERVIAAALPGQDEVEFVIGQITTEASGTVEVVYEDGQAFFVSRMDAGSQQIVPLNAGAPPVVRLKPPGVPGEDRLKTVFTLDGQRQLHLTVTDLKTRRRLLRDVLITTQQPADALESLPAGREPALAGGAARRGLQRLMPHRLGKLLALAAPDSISLDAAAVMLHDEGYYVRYHAARLLSERGDRDARLIMAKALETGSSPTRASVARHVHRLSWYAARPLFEQALADSDERVREAAVYALCEVCELDSYRLLADTLEHETDFVRAAAAWGLRHNQDGAAVPALVTALRAADPDVRCQAVESLGANSASEALPVVRGVLHTDPDPEVVYNAVLSLLELGGEAVLPELAALIKATSGARLEPLLRGLFHASNYLHLDLTAEPAMDDLLAALAHAAADPLPAARLAVIWPLAWMHHARAEALLRDVYAQETGGELRAQMLYICVSLLSVVADELLAEGLNSDDPALRHEAERLQAMREVSGAVSYDADAAAANPLTRAELRAV